MNRTWLAVTACAIATSGCDLDLFPGDQGQVSFTSNLSRPYAAWSQQQRIARGSNVEFRAVDGYPYSLNGRHPPHATPAFDDAAPLFEGVDGGEDFFTGSAAREGTVVLHWSGATASDALTLTVAEADTAIAHDPVLLYTRSFPMLLIDGGLPWNEVADSSVLTPNAVTPFELELRDADGGYLAFSPGAVSAESDGGITTALRRQQLLITPSAPGEVWLRTDAGVIAHFTARPPDSPLATVSLTAHEVDVGIWMLKANAYLESGEEWVQAPFEWEVRGPLVQIRDLTANAPSSGILDRRDFIAVRFDKEITDGGADMEITATLQGKTASAFLGSYSARPFVGNRLGQRAGCSAGGGAMLAWLAALSLCRRRRANANASVDP